MDSQYYDKMFSKSEGYNLYYKDSKYYPLWAQIVYFLRYIDKPKILEVGCGTGQLANYLYDEGFRNYHGFDFSNEAIATAKKNVKQSFTVNDAMNPKSYDFDYNVVIALEVLEHIHNDLKIIKYFKEGSFFLFSLPDFDYEDHVRHFSSSRQIERRYYRFLNIKKIVRFDKWFTAFSVVDNYRPGVLNRMYKTRKNVTMKYVARLIYRRLKKCVG